MQDTLGRKIDYMRISITDRCNLRCRYCMPQDIRTTDMADILTFEEILRVVEAAVGLGIVNYRITGGEPLARKGAVDLVRMVKSVPGVRAVKMTTNAVQLAETAGALADAGLDGLNISLDVLDAQSFRDLTGRDSFDRVMAGIDAAQASGIPIKLNAVSLTGTDPAAMVRFAEERGFPLRFIEMMPIGYGKEFAGPAAAELIRVLEEKFGPAEFVPKVVNRQEAASLLHRDSAGGAAECSGGEEGLFGSGPAVYYRFRDLRRPVGFIRAMSEKFCGSCNRVRLTSEGYLKLCLCYSDGLDLRELLRGGADRETLRGAIGQAIRKKPAEHRFDHREDITEQHGMSAIGG